jgi:hypothetical protein
MKGNIVMIYKFADSIQTHGFVSVQQFFEDLEETFNAKIACNRINEFRTMKIVAPKDFIKDVFYSLIVSPHVLKDVVTRFSMFDEYDLNEIMEIFSDEKNDVIMFTICEDRVCFIDQVRRLDNTIIDEGDDGFNFVYLHNSISYDFMNELRNKRVPTLVFDFK